METPPPGFTDGESKDLVQSSGGGLANRPQGPRGRPSQRRSRIPGGDAANDVGGATRDVDAVNGGTLDTNGTPSLSGERGRLQAERRRPGDRPAPEEPAFADADPEDNENALRGEDPLVDGRSPRR